MIEPAALGRAKERRGEETGFGRDRHAGSPHLHPWGDSGPESLGRWVKPLGRRGDVGLSPILSVWGGLKPVLPWQPDRSLIDSQERTLPI